MGICKDLPGINSLAIFDSVHRQKPETLLLFFGKMSGSNHWYVLSITVLKKTTKSYMFMIQPRKRVNSITPFLALASCQWEKKECQWCI
jgi:hypothetical protein